MSLTLDLADCFKIADWLGGRLPRERQPDLYWKLVSQGLSKLTNANLDPVRSFLRDQARLRVQVVLVSSKLRDLEAEYQAACKARQTSTVYWTKVCIDLLQTAVGYTDVEVVNKLTRATPPPGHILLRGANKYSSRKDKYGRPLTLDEMLLMCPTDSLALSA